MSAPARSAIKHGCEALSEADPALARAYARIGVPDWRHRPRTYEALATIIAYQQISLQAAGSIWARVTTALPAITPSIMLDTDEDTLRSLGLSRPKIRHLKSIATAIDSGCLDLDRLTTIPLEDARAELLAVKGIGPWTAELFLLYALGELDAFPHADVGLMESYKLLSEADTRLDAKAFTEQATHWSPYRGVAAHLLWAWLHAYRAGST